MPGMDGTELTRQSFKALLRLPVVILSFYDLPKLQGIEKAAGVHLRGVGESFLLSWSD
jgi:CheY-like chemotaxis protein